MSCHEIVSMYVRIHTHFMYEPNGKEKRKKPYIYNMIMMTAGALEQKAAIIFPTFFSITTDFREIEIITAREMSREKKSRVGSGGGRGVNQVVDVRREYVYKTEVKKTE